MHNGFVIPKMHGTSMQERLAVMNLILHTLAGIDDNSHKALEYIKQEDAMDFEIVTSTRNKLLKVLSVRRNNIAKSLWMTKTKACIAETFIDKKDYGEHVLKNYLSIYAWFVACSSIKTSSCHH